MIGAMFGSHGWDNLSYPAGFLVNEMARVTALAGVVGSTPWWQALAARMRSPISESVLLFTEGFSFAALIVGTGAFVASQTHVAFIYFRF
jgi:hypothetical protein